MKLTKALKLKNQLAGDVTELKDRLGKQNSRAATVPFDYDSREVLAALRENVDHLITVKSAIAAANGAQYPRIFRLAELKGLVDGLVAELEAEISALQDQLDEFNHAASVELTA